MTVTGRKRKRFGPLVVNFASRGFLRWRVTSWGVKVGRWSWSSGTGQHTVDVPGPWSWRSARRRRRSDGAR